MRALPAAITVTLPLASTVATLSSLDAHFTSWWARAGVMAAVSWNLSPTLTLAASNPSGVETAMPVGAGDTFLTFTRACTVPSTTLTAVTVVLPSVPWNVTTPVLASTSAMVASPVSQ